MAEIHQTRGQKRAQIAYKCIGSRSPGDEDYVQLAKRFPSLVQTCGLSQALAFVDAKEGDAGKSYISHLSKVVGEKGDIREVARTSELMRYQRLTLETIESATWLKRYAEAIL